MLDLRRVRPALWITAALCVALPAPASSATSVGETFDPSGFLCAPGNRVLLQGSPSQYVAPSAGVITSWSHQAAGSPPQLKLKVARAAGGGKFLIVGESSLQTPEPNIASTFPARIPVEAGDVIALYLATVGECYRVASTSYEYYFLDDADPAVGASPTFTGPGTGVQLDIAASLEVDADNDGFGDETQDECPTDATKQTECVPPRTTITKGAPNKTDKSKVKFKFASDEPDSTFECKLKGKGLDQAVKRFGDCTSPRKYKRLDAGKFRFQVRAIDAAGNVDPSPAKDKFKVVG